MVALCFKLGFLYVVNPNLKISLQHSALAAVFSASVTSIAVEG